MIQRCAWELDAGGARARHESSVAKVFVAEAVGRVVDRAVQICGALGVSRRPAARPLPREVRAFRIYDGPTETHRWAIARRAARDRARAVGERLNGAAAVVEIVDTPRGGGRAGARAARSCGARSRPSSTRTASAAARSRARASATGSSNVDVPASSATARASCCAGRRARRCRRRPTTCCARRALLRGARADAACACRAVLAVCDDPAVLGVPFYVMPEVEGDVAHRRAARRRSTRRPSARRIGGASSSTRSSSCTRSTPRPSGLGDFGRPTGYLERQVRRFAGLWEVNRQRDVPARRARSRPGSAAAVPARERRDDRARRLPARQRHVRAGRARAADGAARLGARDARRPAGRPRLPRRDLERRGLARRRCWSSRR